MKKHEIDAAIKAAQAAQLAGGGDGMNMSMDEALALIESAGFSDTAKAILAAEVRRLRDEVNGLTGSLDRAEKALKEAQEQEPAWMMHENGTLWSPKLALPKLQPELFTALYARPVPAAPAVAVPADRAIMADIAEACGWVKPEAARKVRYEEKPAVAVPVVPTDETAKLIVDAIRCDDIGDFLRASDEIAVGVIKSALLRVTGDRK